MLRVLLFCLVFAGLSLVGSCTDRSDNHVYQRLSRWDGMMDSVPHQVVDSLNSLSNTNMSRANRAYYHLLKVISDDKTYVNFTSDSLIVAVSEYYRSHDPKNRNHIRSLAYEGIVRTRMGVKDSTVYDPLREADRLHKSLATPDPALGYLVNYFLGNIHYDNRNYTTAHEYFRHTLDYAREENDSIHVFDAYLALYWNEMLQKKFTESKAYLDTVSTFYNKLPGKDYFILNAQSIYYDVTGQPEIALEQEKAKLQLYDTQDENVELSRLFNNISNRFIGLEQLDSAMVYAQRAIELIEDSTHLQNYLFYQNVADIAEKQGDLAFSNQYLRIAYEMHNQSITIRLDTQIAELEKRYDLTEAENEILRARQQSLSIIIGALILVIVLIIVLMYARKVRRQVQLKLMQTEHRMQQQELQAKILREEAGKRKWLLELYSYISNRLTFLQGEFESLTQRYVSSHPKVHRDMQQILKKTETDLRDITKTLSVDDETFYAYTQLRDEEDVLNPNEKMMLMLLACDADNRELATFMNTSIESIRVRKSQLKKKMQEKSMNTAVFHD